METQNREVGVHLPETTAEKVLQLGSAPVEKLNDEVVVWPAADRPLGCDEVPAVNRAELNADIERDRLARMYDLTSLSMAHLPAIFTPDRWGNLPNRLQRIGGAIDLESGEDCGILRLAFGLALVVLCLGIGFHHALNRALTRVGDSINGGFLVVNDVDSVLDGLDRLSLNQRSFLRTGDLQFSQDVYESVTTIQRHMDSLRQVAREGSRLRDPIARLDRAVDCALDSLRRSDELEKSEGPAVAVASLDKDESIAEAGKEAEHLRNLATDGVFDGVRTERKMKWILDVLF